MAGKRHVIVAVITRMVVSLSIIAVSVGIFVSLYVTRPKAERRSDVQELRRVVVMEAQPVEVQRQFEGYGTAEALVSADVPARVSAVVSELPADIDPGNTVAKGQLIVLLDPSDFERQVEIATNNIADLRAQLDRLEIEEQSWRERVALAEKEAELARAEFERVESAFRNEAAKVREVEIAETAWVRARRELVNTKEELDKIPAARRRLEAQMNGQEASLNLARMNLERCRITSPINGVLQEVDVEEGENVGTGQRVARVVDLRRIEVPIRIPAGSRPFVAPGDTVQLESAGNSRQTWIATVSRIAPEDDATTRSMTVYVVLQQDPGDAGVLAPGKFVRARVSSAKSSPRWIVPRRSMRNDRILLVRDGEIVSRRIAVDFQSQGQFKQFGLPDELWLVLGDDTPLLPGSFVVVTPSRTLTDGLPVEPVLVTGHPAAALSVKEPPK